MDNIDYLQEQYAELKSNLSSLRKKGYDTLIPQLILMQAPAKIQMAQATMEKRDALKAREILIQVKQETFRLQKGSELSQEMTQIYESERRGTTESKYKGVGELEAVHITNKLLNEAYKNLEGSELGEAAHIYKEIADLYKYLPKDAKRNTYPKAVQLRSEIAQNIVQKPKRLRWGSFIYSFRRLFS